MKSLSLRVLSALCFVLVACERPEEPIPPAQLVSKPDLIYLLTELHLTESKLDAARLQRDTAVALFEQIKDSLLRQKNTTDSAFTQSYRYYSVHGKDLQEIYDAVVDTLNQRGVKLRGKASPTPAEPRSEQEHLL